MRETLASFVKAALEMAGVGAERVDAPERFSHLPSVCGRCQRDSPEIFEHCALSRRKVAGGESEYCPRGHTLVGYSNSLCVVLPQTVGGVRATSVTRHVDGVGHFLEQLEVLMPLILGEGVSHDGPAEGQTDARTLHEDLMAVDPALAELASAVAAEEAIAAPLRNGDALTEVDSPAPNGDVDETAATSSSNGREPLVAVPMLSVVRGKRDDWVEPEAGAVAPFAILPVAEGLDGAPSIAPGQYPHLVATVRSLISAVDAKDQYTRGHSERVHIAACVLGRELGLDEDTANHLYWASLLHDVGKIGSPDHILKKPGKLEAHEYRIMKEHPVRGDALLAPLGWLEPSRAGVRHHHERIDGAGYPDGLVGDDIPIIARIIAVADTFDAVVSRRHYRNERDTRQAIEVLVEAAGTQLDVDVVAAFEDAYPRIYAALCEAPIQAEGIRMSEETLDRAA